MTLYFCLIIIMPLFFLVYIMYKTRHGNGQRFIQALEEPDGEGEVLKAIYSGKYKDRHFTYYKAGKMTYLYMDTKNYEGGKGLGGVVFPYGWRKLEDRVLYNKGRLFYYDISRTGFMFFIKNISTEEYHSIFDRLIKAAKKVEAKNTTNEKADDQPA